MSQYLHSMMRLSDTLYYNIIKGNDSGQMEQMFRAMYDGYKDYVESIALFQEMGHFCRSCRHCHLPLPQMLCRKNGFPVHLSEVRTFIFSDRRYRIALNITAVFRG